MGLFCICAPAGNRAGFGKVAKTFMMRCARWIFHDLTPELPGIGITTVASWWPGIYWLVSTVQLDELSVVTGSLGSFPYVEFIQPILVEKKPFVLIPYAEARDPGLTAIYRAKLRVPIGNAVPAANKFITQVFPCNKSYLSWSDNPLKFFEDLMLTILGGNPSKKNRTGDVRFEDPPFFEREYFDLAEARVGHEETVDSLVSGRIDWRKK